MKALQQNLTKLENADTQVLGVSMDSPFSNFAFAQQNGVSFPISATGVVRLPAGMG
jgi:peroxiredoxin